MTSLPLLCQIPTSANGRTSDPLSGPRSARPSHNHPRKWVPAPDSRGRTLVLCFDGTGESFDMDNSNVTKFLAMLKKDDPAQQVVYYQAGIGTYTSHGVLKAPILESISKSLDLMFASNIGNHIKEGYQFLMQNYRAGDQICIFGFSRGAMTARALAGMLQKVGLLPPCNLEQLPFAYAMYLKDDYDGQQLSAQFKQTFCFDVEIKFLGIWDTVHSVGLIEKHLPFSGTNNAILYTRHALSLDERRVKFRPFFWTCRKTKNGGRDTEAPGHSKDDSEDTLHTTDTTEGEESPVEARDYEARVNSENGSETDVKEVFFAGAHCDVGGGSVGNKERHSLARIPLRWMIRECFKTGTGIIFDARMLRDEVGLDIDEGIGPTAAVPKQLSPGVLHKSSGGELGGFSPCYIPAADISGFGSPSRWARGKLSSFRLRNSKKPKATPEQPEPPEPESQEELKDVLSPIVDQIKMHPAWNIVEWMPWLVKKQEVEEADDIWAYKWTWNRGKGREVYKGVMNRGIKVHRSVRTRVTASPVDGSNERYVPKIRFLIDGKLQRLTWKEWSEETPEHFEWVD